MVPLSLPTLGLAQKRTPRNFEGSRFKSDLICACTHSVVPFGYAATYDLHHVPYAVWIKAKVLRLDH